MTQDEQDNDLIMAQTHLTVPSIRVDRCRFESVTETSLWFFNDQGTQIASATKTPEHPDYNWRVNCMQHGMPISERRVVELFDVVGIVQRYHKNGVVI